MLPYRPQKHLVATTDALQDAEDTEWVIALQGFTEAEIEAACRKFNSQKTDSRYPNPNVIASLAASEGRFFRQSVKFGCDRLLQLKERERVKKMRNSRTPDGMASIMDAYTNFEKRAKNAIKS